MAITLTYPADPRLQAQAAYLAGQGQFAQRQDQFRQGVDQFALNLGQRQSEFDRSYALDQAKFGYGQFDDARRFGETQRQFDLGYGLDNARFQYGMYNDGRNFDEGVRRFDLGFGEQVRQADIDNQFRDVKFADDQAQFGANLGLQYDRMAQEQFQREQAMAFEAQQQAQRLQASFAEQQSAQAQQRWGAYQQLEAQRFGVFAKQGMAELDILRNKNFRTPELRQQAFEQWQQQYGQYLPAPIDVGEPPAVQDPWEAIPTRQITLPDGTTATAHLISDGKGGWKPDYTEAELILQSQEKGAENRRRAEQYQIEQDHDLAAKRAERLYQDAKAQQEAIAKQNDLAAKAEQARIATEQKRQDAIMSYITKSAATFQQPDKITGAVPQVTDAQIDQWRKTAESIFKPVATPQPQSTGSGYNAVADVSVTSQMEYQEVLHDLKAQGHSGKAVWITYQGQRKLVRVP